MDAETKDHQNWTLLGELAKDVKNPARDLLTRACEEVEEQEDEHLYHTRGWSRELALAHLGLPAQLPPPEETRDVRTALEAAQAEKDRKAPA